MNVEELRDYCLSLHGAEENAPWTEPKYQMLVTFVAGGKWFCLADIDKKFIDVKCAPEQIVEMQEKYRGAFPAWHMNKNHWLGVELESDVPDDVICQLLKGGYELIVKSFSAKKRKELGLM
ncbi:MAG: MmcQ/YjbR family DNA-binding protein [Prevotellaceae bacterium]|nr:MmcQ/YjbR family DNA-binding protein [Prevotellaceae bacterium]